jgi:hypothetical protein
MAEQLAHAISNGKNKIETPGAGFNGIKVIKVSFVNL